MRKTAHERLRKWTADGTWERIVAEAVERVVADKACAHRPTRQAPRRRGIKATIAGKSDQIARREAKGPAGGRPPAFDPEIYRQRSVVGRCTDRLKQFRAFATRYAKRAA
ncbi:hypothetical protein GCM10023225_05420 [Kineococcus glutinatus]|uniref:Transposase n=1 Tax=Kineococcus glutinatus TaxID=1070872 RepID=A0ABP9H9X8_9ACTN